MSGHSPAKGVRRDALMDGWAPFYKFLEEALGYVEKCFAVEEQVAQRQNGCPFLGVSKEVMANACVQHGEKGSEEEE